MCLQKEMLDVFNVLVLCHTCRVDRKDNVATGGYSETGFEYEYQASSPDEKALVEACRRLVNSRLKDNLVVACGFLPPNFGKWWGPVNDGFTQK